MNMKELVELFGGKYLFGGALIQFGDESFKEMYKQIYDAAMLTEREECAKLCEDSVEYAGGELARQIRARTDHDPAREQE
jgi:hypothetical protein